MKISEATAEKLMKKYHINDKVMNIEWFIFALNVELEHGTKYKKYNITDNDLNMTAKIVCAHLAEFPDYYKRLKKMESRAESYWSTHKKPKIFI